jgi:predicted lipoprotein with Yx(FWY)xxD motif
MKMKLTGLIIMVAGALSLAGLGAAMASRDSTSRPATISVARTGLGRIIVSGSGRTLYLFERDRRGHSACAGACAVYWPPLITRGKPLARGGAKQSLLGTIKRANGARQVTYAGHPLYRFVQDVKRGDTKGEGLNFFGGGWDALTPAGKKIEKDG